MSEIQTPAEIAEKWLTNVDDRTECREDIEDLFAVKIDEFRESCITVIRESASQTNEDLADDIEATTVPSLTESE